MIASMNIKREAIGVVDAISAEDIGKFPDTNLAESLQRISGVSIDRVAGEGSRVTARGFGPGFNLVTLNGRQMPTADVVVVGSRWDGEYGTFTSRSFDFSNLASEGVTGLEVYKTGRAVDSVGWHRCDHQREDPAAADGGQQGLARRQGHVRHECRDWQRSHAGSLRPLQLGK